MADIAPYRSARTVVDRRTAVARVAGLAVFLAVTTPLWREGQPLWLTVVIGILAEALMATTVTALTGLGAVRLQATVITGSAAPITTAALPETSINGASPPARIGIPTEATLWQ